MGERGIVGGVASGGGALIYSLGSKFIEISPHSINLHLHTAFSVA